MFTFTWIYWYTITWAWRSSQKLLARWSGWGFNFKAQLASDNEPRCSCGYGPGKDMYWLQRKQNWVLPVWLLPKMSLHLNLCHLPGEAGEPTGNPLHKCLENADSLKWYFPQSPGLLSVGKKSLGSRMKFPIATWERSAQHKAAVAWQAEYFPRSPSVRAGASELCRNTAFIMPVQRPDDQQFG